MKVKDVLEKIGDGPLIEALKARSYSVFPQTDEGDVEMASSLKEGGWGVFGDDDYEALVRYAIDHHVPVLELHVDIEEGFHLYRMRRTEEFRNWLREFFYQQLGRIV